MVGVASTIKKENSFTEMNKQDEKNIIINHSVDNKSSYNATCFVFTVFIPKELW